MTLIDQFNASEDSNFHSKIIIAMAKKMGIKLGTVVPADPDYPSVIKMARESLGVDSDKMRFAARILAANDINDGSSDAEIQAAVDANFDRLAKVFDPSVG